MSTVFFQVGVSLDGCIAGRRAGPDNPLGDGGPKLHEWIYNLASWRERLGLPGGLRDDDDSLVRAGFQRAGAYVMGRRMFDEGEANWPEEAPFRAPVFVVTRKPRDPWIRPGGTTFHFVTDGVHSALNQARAAARDGDVKIAGGASVIRQCLEGGQVDDFTLHLAPVLLGGGVRLFEDMNATGFDVESAAVGTAGRVTHLRYRVRR